MDNRSPKSKSILGPRPTPLKICKESHKIIKKPPLVPQPRLQPPEPAPPPQLHQQEPLQSQPPRGPVIIYTVSPKIIHTHPNNFMALVQRLTGKSSTSTTTSSLSSQSILAPNNMSATFDTSCGEARYDVMEKANASNEVGCVGGIETTNQYYHHHHHHHQNQAMEIPNFYNGGILSPGPTSLPLISPEFFSTVEPTDPQGLSTLFNDFNSILQTSPPKIPSPSMNHFNNFFDS